MVRAIPAGTLSQLGRSSASLIDTRIEGASHLTAGQAAWSRKLADLVKTAWGIYANLRRRGPISRRKFGRAEGKATAICRGDRAMCTESFGNTNVSSPSHNFCWPGTF